MVSRLLGAAPTLIIRRRISLSFDREIGIVTVLHAVCFIVLTTLGSGPTQDSAEFRQARRLIVAMSLYVTYILAVLFPVCHAWRHSKKFKVSTSNAILGPSRLLTSLKRPCHAQNYAVSPSDQKTFAKDGEAIELVNRGVWLSKSGRMQPLATEPVDASEGSPRYSTLPEDAGIVITLSDIWADEVRAMSLPACQL